MDDGHSSTYSRRVVPQYDAVHIGIQHESNFRADLPVVRSAETIRTFSDRRADIALVPAAAVPSLTDARIVTEYCVGGLPAAREMLLAGDDPLLEAWKPCRKTSLRLRPLGGSWRWEPETVEALQHALTYGLERGYEAILSSPFAADPGRAYEGLACFDYIFDNQKDKALKVLGLGPQSGSEGQSRLKRLADSGPPLCM